MLKFILQVLDRTKIKNRKWGNYTNHFYAHNMKKAIQDMNNQSAGKYELKSMHLNLSHLEIFGMHFQLHYQL